MSLDRPRKLVISFICYLTAIAVFAIIYQVLYEKKGSNFLFNRDIDQYKKEMRKEGLRHEIHSIGESIIHIQTMRSHLNAPSRHFTVTSNQYGTEVKLTNVNNPLTYRFDHVIYAGPYRYSCSVPSLSVFDHDGNIIEEIDLLAFGISVLPKTIPDIKTLISSVEDSLLRKQSSLHEEFANFPDHASEAWTFVDFLYFSTITQTTIGYGDILPNTSVVRIIVIAQIIVGLSILVVVVNIIISRKASQ